MKTVYCYSSETVYYRTPVEVPDDADQEKIYEIFYEKGIGNDDEIYSSGWQLDEIKDSIELQA